MAKQAQSSSQLMVPHETMRPIWVQRSRTAVIQSMIEPTCACVSPWGRLVRATEIPSAPDTTKRSGRS